MLLQTIVALLFLANSSQRCQVGASHVARVSWREIPFCSSNCLVQPLTSSSAIVTTFNQIGTALSNLRVAK
jgi:hypothetical protein